MVEGMVIRDIFLLVTLLSKISFLHLVVEVMILLELGQG